MAGWGTVVWSQGDRYIISTVRARHRWETAAFRDRGLFLFGKKKLYAVHPISEDAAKKVHEAMCELISSGSYLALERPEFFPGLLRMKEVWDLTEESQAGAIVRLNCERCGVEYDFNTATEKQGGPYLCRRCRAEEKAQQ